MELVTYVFEEGGPQNTDPTLEIARRRARELEIRQVVVASSHGETARRTQALLGPDGVRVIAVRPGAFRTTLVDESGRELLRLAENKRL